MSLSFDREKHEYRWQGQIVPSVTQIISSLTDLSMIKPEVLEHARQEGVAIHRMVELDAKNDLDVKSLPDWMMPRYEGWCQFKEDTGFQLLASETCLFHRALGYAGTPDLFCHLPKLRLFSKGVANLDLKRSLFSGPVIGLQTAGYSAMYDQGLRPVDRVQHRGALVLTESSTYRLTPYEDPDDWTAFLACLQQLRWKEKYGRT